MNTVTFMLSKIYFYSLLTVHTSNCNPGGRENRLTMINQYTSMHIRYTAGFTEVKLRGSGEIFDILIAGQNIDGGYRQGQTYVTIPAQRFIEKYAPRKLL